MLRAKDLAYGIVNCIGKHTLTGMLTACGKQFKDWSSSYRLFQSDKMSIEYMFGVIRKELVNHELNQQDPVYAHMDDTILKKTGKKVYGTAWRRDPQGPPFHTNFIWGQRFIQLSISLPEKHNSPKARAIPVDFHHCPTVTKPKKHESEEIWQNYREQKKQAKLSQKGVERIIALRDNLDKDGATDKPLIISVDGSYTNETVLKKLPKRTTIIGRIRKDTKLNSIPDVTQKGVGRNRVYGQDLPTPEEIRQDPDIPWQEVSAYAAGKKHAFNVKVIKDVRWRKAGKQNLKLVIIRPLAYRLTKKSKTLYRQPAYLICTDAELNISQLLQAYLWRWEIEVNFKEEKSILGCGQAQVRTEKPIEKVPAFIAIIYSFIQIAAHRAHKEASHKQIPRSKWYPNKKSKIATTGDIVNEFKSQLWAKSININFSHFVNLHERMRSQKNSLNPTISATFYARF